MFKGAKTPQEIIELVLEKIAAMPGGLREAFLHDGRIQLYSGPYDGYAKLLIGPNPRSYRNNHRAEKQAKEWNAARLDDTAIGKFLFVENDLYEYLNSIYADPATVDKAGLQITTVVSALFIRAAYGDVQTAVCGADRKRVFYKTEIKGLCDRESYPSEAEFLVERLLDNQDITSINGTPMAVFRALHKAKGVEAVYDRICLTELRNRKERARQTGDKADYEDYLDRLELYRLDKNSRLPKPSHDAYNELTLPKTERMRRKQKRLKDFAAAAKEAETSNFFAPTIPSQKTKGAKLRLSPTIHR